MSRLTMVIGMGIAALRDMSFGLIVAHLLSRFSGRPVSLGWYAAGVLLAVLPDLDILGQKVCGQAVNSEHRKGMHAPLLMIGIAFALYPLFPRLSVLAAVCFFFHFVEDTVGDENEGAGIAWLWPFSGKLLSLLFQENGKYRLAAFREQEAFTPLTLEAWLRRYWLRPTKEVFFNLIAVLSAAAIVLLF